MSDLQITNDKTIKTHLSSLSVAGVLTKERIHGKENIWHLNHDEETFDMIQELVFKLLNSPEESAPYYFETLIRIHKSDNYQKFLRSPFMTELLIGEIVDDSLMRDMTEKLVQLFHDALSTLPTYILCLTPSSLYLDRVFYHRNFSYYKEVHDDSDNPRNQGAYFWDIIFCVGQDRYITEYLLDNLEIKSDSDIKTKELEISRNLSNQVITEIDQFIDKWSFILDPIYKLMDKSLIIHKKLI